MGRVRAKATLSSGGSMTGAWVGGGWRTRLGLDARPQALQMEQRRHWTWGSISEAQASEVSKSSPDLGPALHACELWVAERRPHAGRPCRVSGSCSRPGGLSPPAPRLVPGLCTHNRSVCSRDIAEEPPLPSRRCSGDGEVLRPCCT